MVTGKCVVADTLVVAWERAAGNGKQWLLTILSWEIFDLRYFVWERTGRVIID